MCEAVHLQLTRLIRSPVVNLKDFVRELQDMFVLPQSQLFVNIKKEVEIMRKVHVNTMEIIETIQASLRIIVVHFNKGLRHGIRT